MDELDGTRDCSPNDLADANDPGRAIAIPRRVDQTISILLQPRQSLAPIANSNPIRVALGMWQNPIAPAVVASLLEHELA